MGKIKEKLDILKFERNLVKTSILKMEPKLKKRNPEMYESGSEIDEKEIEQLMMKIDKEKMKKKLERENGKEIKVEIASLKHS